ncbi:MAG: aldehyde dehydrogenase family protein, partial [Comamonas sp.]
APIGSPMRKIAAALSAGCALILKPAEETPAGAFHIAQALVDAGLPPGGGKLLFGDPVEISRTLVESDTVRMLTFTGSVPVGRQLAQMAAAQLKPCLLELGGHAPVIVCADTDPVAVAGLAAQAKANNTGQICVSPTRFLVAENIFEAFVQAFAEKARAVVIGDGLAQGTHIGPLTNARRRQDIERLVDDARARGARVLCGGERPPGKGYFYPLTVLADVPEGAQVLREEPFGPIAIINRFAQLDDAIAQANALNVGLAAYAFTNNADVQEQLAAQIEAGSLAINTFTVSSAETPFGGVKDSGFGREGGAHSLDAYTVLKSVMQASHAQVLA